MLHLPHLTARRTALAFCVAALAAWDAAAAQDDSTSAFRLTSDERALARSIAERAIDSSPLRVERSPEAATDGPMYLVGMELELANKPDGDAGRGRLARVLHYRYAGNLTIETVVDLADRTVVSQRTATDRPTRLAPAEIARVSELVLANPRVREAVVGQGTEVVPMVFGPPPDTPLFGTRAVLVQLRDGDRFLNLPYIVYVDLTNARVILEDRTRDDASR